MSPALEYKISRGLGLVRVYPANLPSIADREAFGTDLDATDIIRLLSELTVPTTMPRSLALRIWNRLNGQSVRSLAADYGVSTSTIYLICNGRLWASVPDDAVTQP